jgi:hypothetical protein
MRLPGSCDGTINGSFSTSFCPRSSGRPLRIRCLGRVRDISAPAMTYLSRSNLLMQPIDTATLRFDTDIISMTTVSRFLSFPISWDSAKCRANTPLTGDFSFDSPDVESAQRAKKIDGKLVSALIELPIAVTGETEIEAYHSLAVRDLQRGQDVGLPSGEVVARHLGIDPLTADEVGIPSTCWRGDTPLWYYILREADICEGGHRLGPVGGRIVAEVFVGLVDADVTSYRRSRQEWRPKKTLSALLAS